MLIRFVVKGHLKVDVGIDDHDDHLSNQVLWYKDTMKLIEGDRIHMANVGNTYKLSIAGDDEDVDDHDDFPTFIHHDENHDGDCDTCIYIYVQI